jgi:magnesium-protoporphyrin O-methyltransferase
MAAGAGGDEMESVKNYFNTTGFERWNKIYGTTSEVNKVQLDIRTGHAQTVDKVLKWLQDEGGVRGVSVCDVRPLHKVHTLSASRSVALTTRLGLSPQAGCGTGSLAIPLALAGAAVNASDISSSMVGEAQRRYDQAVAAPGATAPAASPVFATSDLESVRGKYHTVTCLDVMIHYPQDKADAMVQHLASLAEERLILSFAPKTLAYTVLKRIGELFPGPSKATRAYLHAEADVEAALARVGWKVKRREMTATSFYFSRLLEFVRA